jgi:hypothetical protein
MCINEGQGREAEQTTMNSGLGVPGSVRFAHAETQVELDGQLSVVVEGESRLFPAGLRPPEQGGQSAESGAYLSAELGDLSAQLGDISPQISDL